jgi:tetratricopeptide (TPR) repeat protein
MFGLELSWILSGLSLVPYLLWGVYCLDQQLRREEELDITAQALTLAALIPFYAFQYEMLKSSLVNSNLKFALAIIGLMMSGAALYGPLAASFVSHLVVESVMPSHRKYVHEPRFGPGEAMEEVGNYEAAAQEYMAVAKMFPKDPGAALRTADNLMKCGKLEEAAPWFEKTLDNMTSAKQSLAVTFRLFELYTRALNKPEAGLRILEKYVQRFPETEYVSAVRRRIASFCEPPKPTAAPWPSTAPDIADGAGIGRDGAE